MYLKDKYVNPLTDFGFKKLFGEEPNKELLIDFLNQLLPEAHKIEELTYSKNEHLGQKALDRRAIFDLHCKNAKGDWFIVELQKAKQNYFKDRSVYYSTFPIQEQARRGDWDFQLAAVYTIGVLDFIFDESKEEPAILHKVQLKNERNQVFSGFSGPRHSTGRLNRGRSGGAVRPAPPDISHAQTTDVSWAGVLPAPPGHYTHGRRPEADLKKKRARPGQCTKSQRCGEPDRKGYGS